MSPVQQADPERYRNGWAAIVQFVRDGHSWSGNERNRLLLNTGSAGPFVDASFVSGADHDGDGRALGIVDWDRDGDLDLWYRNRTAPRLQFLRNRHRSEGPASDFVALRLHGTDCNRDAIGAVVEVVTEPSAGRLVRSVRAGDLFLSQSSRWLHFGLGPASSVREIQVLWPGGARETFQGAKAGGFFLLEQGTGTATATKLPASPAPSTPGEVAVNVSAADQAQVILPARIPCPTVTVLAPGGQTGPLALTGSPHLLVFWSADCARCQTDLPALAQAAGSFASAGVQVSALAVDQDPAARRRAITLMETLGGSLQSGLTDTATLDRLDAFQRALFDVTVPLSTPLALLCDPAGNILSLYRGALEPDRMVADWKRLAEADGNDLHALAPPLAGRWFTKPVDPAYAMEFMARQFDARLPEDALVYLEAAWERAAGERRTALGRELAGRHAKLARTAKAARQPDKASVHFERALALGERADLCLDYGTMLASYGHLREAETLLERALVLEPGLVPASKALTVVRRLIAEGN